MSRCLPVVAAMLISACGVSHNPSPTQVAAQGDAKPCVPDDTHPFGKQRTFKIGERKIKVRLDRCVADAVAVVILDAYGSNHVMDRRAQQTPLRPSSAETICMIDVITDRQRAQKEHGLDLEHSQYMVSLDWSGGNLQFVSVDDGIVTLWGTVLLET